MITRVTACTLAQSPIRDTLTRGFSHFVTSMTVPVASGWSVCRVGLAPTAKRRLVGCPFSPAAATHPHQLRRVGVSSLGGTCDDLSASAHSIVNGCPRLSPPSVDRSNAWLANRASGPTRINTLALCQIQQRNSLRFEVSGDVFRMPADDYVDFSMLLQFFERICPRRVQQPILCLRFVDPSCY